MLKLRVVKVSTDENMHEVGLRLLKSLLHDFNIDNYEIIYNENGKPYLKDSNYYFSISHSIDTVICVISNREIGVDIEKIREFDKRMDNELKINSINNMEFFKEWTRRESYIKMKGLTLSNIRDIKIDTFINTYLRNGYVISICEREVKEETD